MPAEIQGQIDDLTEKLQKLLALQREQMAKDQPLSLQDLIGHQIPTPIPIGTPLAQGYAPGGPQLNFTGGSPFPANQNAAVLHNGLNAFFSIEREMAMLRKKADEKQKQAEAASAGV